MDIKRKLDGKAVEWLHKVSDEQYQMLSTTMTVPDRESRKVHSR
jgi:hypothetical protein